jgi:hypothetical protein
MIRAATAAAILTCGLASVGCVSTGSTGCGGSTGAYGNGKGNCGDHYRNFVDPCYPERYEYAARQAVIAPFAQQVHNGYVMNLTIWNYYFETGSDKLTLAGYEKLDSLARVRPGPDSKLYLQTARDLPANTDPAKAPDLRADLDVKRATAIQKYMSSQPAFGGPVAYEIYVHDATPTGINAEMGLRAYNGSFQGYRGGVSGGGTGVLGTGGATNLTTPTTSGGAGTVGTGGGYPR